MDPFFAEPVAGGNLIPELMLGMGCASLCDSWWKVLPGIWLQNGMPFPDRLQAESTSRNSRPEWDILSQRDRSGKLRLTFRFQSGMHFPKVAPAESSFQNPESGERQASITEIPFVKPGARG